MLLWTRQDAAQQQGSGGERSDVHEAAPRCYGLQKQTKIEESIRHMEKKAKESGDDKRLKQVGARSISRPLRRCCPPCHTLETGDQRERLRHLYRLNAQSLLAETHARDSL